MKKSFQIFHSFIFLLSIFLKISFGDGLLTVHTSPEGAEIWLNDQYAGNSPLNEKKLKPGKYFLKFIDPVQHTSSVEDIFIQDNQTTTIEKVIKPKFGVLRVDSDPQGAHVSISTELGDTPLSNDFMNPGKYRIEVRYPNRRYHTSIENVTILNGEAVNLNKTLEKEKLLNNKALLRIVLGAGSIGAFTWAVIEQGKYKTFSERSENAVQDHQHDYEKKSDQAKKRRTIAIAVGSACVIGFEISAFF